MNQDEKQYLDLLQTGLSHNQVCAQMGVHRSQPYRWRKKSTEFDEAVKLAQSEAKANAPPKATQFQPGNPGGPGAPSGTVHVRELAKQHTEAAVQALLNVMNDLDAPAKDRIAAALGLLDRAWGKPANTVEVQGEGAKVLALDLL